MVTSSEMTAKLKVMVDINHLALVDSETYANGTFRGVYNITKDILFSFQEGSQYAWAFSIGGIQSSPNAFDTFTVIEQPPPFIQIVFDWIVATVAGILCVIVLTTNTRKHHWAWHGVALVATIACIVVTPFLKGPVRALNGHWAILAIVNLSLVLICIVWAFIAEMKKFNVKDFATKKDEFQQQYVRMQFAAALNDLKTVVHPEDMSLFAQVKQMVKPFNPQTCFYFPTQILVGFCLAMFSFGFLIIKTVELALNIRKTLQALLNKVTQQGLGLMNSMDQVFFKASGGAELPDSAMQFVVTQLRMVTDWFESLILGFEIGIWLGCVLAAIVTMIVLFGTFLDFRRRVLNLRRGKLTFRKKDCLLYMDSNFMGSFIATTVVGYIVIVLAITLVTVPLVWDVSREIIWAMRHFVTWALIGPLILTQIQNQIFRRCLFGKDFVMHRPLLSIYVFWQTWLSFLGGIMVAIIRLVMALLGNVLSLPQMMFPCTPDFMNHVTCLDSTYKQYLAAVVMYHISNNPVANVAAKKLMALLRERKRRMKDEGATAEQLTQEARRKTKRMLILLLMKRPVLAQYRKSAIVKHEAQLKEEEEERKKQKVVVPHNRKPSSDEVKLIMAIHDSEMELAELEAKTKREVTSLKETLSQVRQLPIGSAEAAHLVEAAIHQTRMTRS